MPLPVPRRAPRVVLTVATAALLTLTLTSQPTHAANACFGDPLVTLPNGITVDLHEQIGDDFSDVQHIAYVLHGPALSGNDPAPGGAVLLGSEWYMATYPDGTGPISSLTYVPDSKPHQFYADITVTTGTAAVTVTAYLDWTAGGKHNSGTATVSGISGQPVETPVLRIVCANECTG